MGGKILSLLHNLESGNLLITTLVHVVGYGYNLGIHTAIHSGFVMGI